MRPLGAGLVSDGMNCCRVPIPTPQYRGLPSDSELSTGSCGRASGRSGRCLQAVLALALSAGDPGHAQTQDPQPPAPAAISAPSMTVEQAVRVLADSQSPDEALAAAAAALISRSEAPDVARELQAALSPTRSSASRTAIADQISQSPTVPFRGLIPALAENLDPADPALTTSALKALARYQSREAVRAILDGFLPVGRPVPAELTSRACETLAAQTGLVDLGDELDAWRAWWNRAQWLTEQEWRTQVGRQQAAAAQALRRQRAAAVALVVDLYRRLHAAAPDATRPDLLAEMMAAGESEVRRLGLDLTMRALLNGKAIDDTVAGAVAARLSDSSPSVRAEAATILDRLNRPRFGPALRDALRREQNPTAAAAMLRAAQNDPDESVIAASLTWIRNGQPASDAAIAALLAAHSKGALEAPGLVIEVRAELERLYPNLLTSDAMSLLVALGDGQAVIDLLDSADPARATMAANALVDWAPAVDALVASAGQRSALRDAAVRSLMRHRLTAGGFSAARALLDEREPSHWDALLQYARSLPADELLILASAERTPESREALIAHTVTPDFLAQVAEPTARIDLLVLALQTRLTLGRAADALAVLDATPTEWLGPRLRALRVTALLCLNRITDAVDYTRQSSELGADALMLRAWVDALALSIQQGFAEQIRDKLVEVFPDVATSAEAYRFGALTNRLPIPAPSEVSDASPPAETGGKSSAPSSPAGP